jgi:predicted DNA binding CopG/RHH family protein
MKKNAFADGSAKLRHSIGQPGRHAPAMQRKIGVAGASHLQPLSNLLPESAAGGRPALHLEQMSKAVTVRIPSELAQWLDKTARKTGVPKARIIRETLEKARRQEKRPFLRIAGAVSGPENLSIREGFSLK